MHPVFTVLFVLGYFFWIIVDYAKVRDSLRSKMMFFAIQICTAIVFCTLLWNIRLPNPVTLLHDFIYPWADALIGEISYVQTND